MTDKATPPNRTEWIGSRGRKIIRTGAWSLVAKVAAAANLFLSIPFVLDVLGPEQFGAWATLTSLVIFAGFLDFGMGNGTMNLVASAHGRGADEEAGIVYREGQRALTLIALILGAAVLLALPLMPWHKLLGLPPSMASVSKASAAVVLFAVVLGIPLNLATRVQLGLGRGDRAFRWQIAGQLLTLIAVILSARAHASLPILTAAAVTGPLLGSLGNTLSLRRIPPFSTGPRERRHDVSLHIKHEGLLFFTLQICAAIAFLTDLPVISALRGSVDAGAYAITQRLFSIIPIGLGLIWSPLWPIYRQALAAGNHAWATQTLRNSLVLSIAISIAVSLAIGFGFNYITSIWLPEPVHITKMLVVGFAAWTVVDAAGMAIATFLNAASIVRYQVVVGCAFAAICLASKIWAISRFGITAAPWCTMVSYSAVCLIPTIFLMPRLLKTALEKKH